MSNLLIPQNIRDVQLLVIKSLIIGIGIYYCVFVLTPFLVKLFCRCDILSEVREKQLRDSLLDHNNVELNIVNNEEKIKIPRRSKVPRPLNLLSPKNILGQLNKKIDENSTVAMSHIDGVEADISDDSIFLEKSGNSKDNISELGSDVSIQAKDINSCDLKKQPRLSIMKRKELSHSSSPDTKQKSSNYLDEEVNQSQSRASLILSQDTEYEISLQRDILNQKMKFEEENMASSAVITSSEPVFI